MSEPVDRLGAALSGRYRVERELGEGGMATVYLAEDLKHHRNVALKVLKPELAAVVGAERFLAEIETTANLQHPHILPLFDSGEADSFLFYVMPYVEGESLREWLDRERQLPVDESVDMARKVADALQYAHEQGVVHRDIKPANILLSRGNPLVADFGIALAVSEAGGGRITETGLSLGTPHYMSPEQAAGERTLDKRSDVYALGCVLYEMLAGEPPHGGPTSQAVLAKILTAQPRRVTELRRTVPPNVDAAVARALEKLPADRFAGAEDFRAALADPAFRHEPVAGPGGEASARPRGTPPAAAGALRLWAPWGVAALALLALGLGWSGRDESGPATPEVPRVKAVLDLPGNAAVDEVPVAIANDGSVVVVSGAWNGRSILLVRRTDELEFSPLPGSEGALRHFLSPDARWVAFNRGGELVRLPLTGGPPVVLDPEGDWAGGAWTADGTIYYSRSYRSGLWRTPAEESAPERVSEPIDGELAHWWPQVLPGGEHVLFTAMRTPVEDALISVLSLETGERKDVLRGGVHGTYVPTGHLLFARGEALYAAPFDLASLEVTGGAVPVVKDVAMEHVDGLAAYDVSDDGTLVYVPASDYNAPSDLVWVDRDGREEPVVPDAGRYDGPALSPDGRSVAVALAATGEAPDVWILDLVRGTRARITSGGGSDFAPLWTPSGERLVYVSERPVFDLFSRSADASSPSSALVTDAFDKAPGSFTPDGDTLLFERYTDVHVEAWKVPLGGGEAELVYAPDFDVSAPTLSPDGRWLAYVSDESGRDQVYLSLYADPASLRRQVSVEGGRDPRWTRGGRELVFQEGGRILAVPVDPTSGELGRPRILFEGTYQRAGVSFVRSWDVTPDGERFLMVRRPPERRPRRVVVVTGFFEELRALGGGGS